VRLVEHALTITEFQQQTRSRELIAIGANTRRDPWARSGQ
jgi:hypothetical protein